MPPHALLPWLILERTPGLGPVRINRLLDTFGSPEGIFDAPNGDLLRTGLLNLNLLGALKDPATRETAQADADHAESLGITIVTLHDPRYPALLKAIYAPPPVLFIKGDTARIANRTAIAIVGTRQPTPYGIAAAKHFAAGLARSGIPIVSGLALGIDTIAHEVCLGEGMATVAVLGGGPDVVYPTANRKLYDRIVEQGLVVSEFPPGTRPEAWNFPRRNRIISGLSAGTLVVEAGFKSGSLITAYDALHQNRDVFAIPGPIFSSMSNGTLRLIRDGATPVGNPEHILEVLRTGDLFAAAEDAPSKHLAPPADLLTRDERIIVTALGTGAMRVDEIAEKTGKGLSELYTILLTLELKGVIRQGAGQLFEAV